MGVHRESERGKRAKAAVLRAIRPLSPGQRCPGHCPPPYGAVLASEEAFYGLGVTLGPPLNVRRVAALIGCSPWTVRQTLIPRGLPHFRFKASGRLVFYHDQVVRWIEREQQGG